MKKAIIQTDFLVSLPIQITIPGSVKVFPGQNVQAGDVLAETKIPAKFKVFDVINQFRIKPEEFDGCLTRLIGETVQEGDVIAKKSGLITKVFRAPEAGKVVAIHDGRIVLAMGEKLIQAISPINGLVGEVIPERGAVLVSRGQAIQGTWGNGLICQGKLAIIQSIDEETLQKAKEAIVFLDKSANEKDLTVLQKAGAIGVLVSSLKVNRGMNYGAFTLPLMSLLGFGEINLDKLTRQKLNELESSQVNLIARIPEPNENIRPLLFKVSENLEKVSLFSEERNLEGQLVRVLGEPYFGVSGEVLEISSKLRQLESGVKSKLVLIKCEDESTIKVPLENLEFLTD